MISAGLANYRVVAIGELQMDAGPAAGLLP